MAPSPDERVERGLDAPPLLVGRAASGRVAQARLEVMLEHELGRAVDRAADGRELDQDVGARSPCLNHSLDRCHVPGRPRELGGDGRAVRVWMPIPVRPQSGGRVCYLTAPYTLSLYVEYLILSRPRRCRSDRLVA